MTQKFNNFVKNHIKMNHDDDNKCMVKKYIPTKPSKEKGMGYLSFVFDEFPK